MVPAQEASHSPTCSVVELSEDRHQQWRDYVRTHTHTTAYHELPWQAVVRRVFGHETPYRIAVDDNDAIVGVLPLVRLRSRLFGHFLVSVPFFNYGGALGDTPAVEDALMVAAGDLAKRTGAGHVEFRDVAPRNTHWPSRTDKVTMELSLPDTVDALWKQIGTKVRAQVKRPQRESVSAVVGGEELVDEFYGVFCRNMRDLGTPVYSAELFREVLRAAEGGFCVVVRHAGRAVAGAVLVGHRDRLEIPWASSLREVNRLGVNMYLYWNVLAEAVERGYRIFDFGRSTKDAGTYRFKKQWGSEPVPLHWHYWLAEGDEPPALNPDNPKYRLAIQAWQRLPLAVANVVGPRIVRNLP